MKLNINDQLVSSNATLVPWRTSKSSTPFFGNAQDFDQILSCKGPTMFPSRMRGSGWKKQWEDDEDRSLRTCPAAKKAWHVNMWFCQGIEKKKINTEAANCWHLPGAECGVVRIITMRRGGRKEKFHEGKRRSEVEEVRMWCNHVGRWAGLKKKISWLSGNVSIKFPGWLFI